MSAYINTIGTGVRRGFWRGRRAAWSVWWKRTNTTPQAAGQTFHVDPPAMNTAFGIEGSDCAYAAPGSTAIRTVYNERGQPRVVVFSDASGCEISRVELSYDGNGNLIEEAQIRQFNKSEFTEVQTEAMRRLLASMRRTHLYDEHGRRVETLLHMGMICDDRRTMTYNEYGDKTGEFSVQVERQYEMDDQGNVSEKPATENTRRSESRIRYEYDACGNWVTKTVDSRGGPDQEFVVSSVDRRVIGYFE